MSTGASTKQATLNTDDEESLDKINPLFASRLLSHHKRVSLLHRILSFHETKSPKDLIELRSSSKSLRNALRPPPLWTSFPNSNYASLQSLLDHLEQLHSKESSGNVPSLLFIEEGEYVNVAEEEYVKMKIPLSIYGAGCEKTTLVGVGLLIRGSKSDGSVVIEDLTVQKSTQNGLCAVNGMNLIVRRCKVEMCQSHGVYAFNAYISCDDVQVVGCVYSGVCAHRGGTVKLSGANTRIEGNVTGGHSRYYGLHTHGSSAKIQIVTPLTKDTISINNGGGGNWGGSGIEQVSK